MPCLPFLPSSGDPLPPFWILTRSGTPAFSVSAPVLPSEHKSDRRNSTSVAPTLGRLPQQGRSLARCLARNPARRNSRPRGAERLGKKHLVARHSASAALERRRGARRPALQGTRLIRQDRSADEITSWPRNQHRSTKSVEIGRARLNSSHQIISYAV